jgi:hypothetical protein
MAPSRRRTEHDKTMPGQAPHEALVRVDARVKDILARRQTAVRQAQLAARRLKQVT